MHEGKRTFLSLSYDGLLDHGEQVCVSLRGGLKKEIIDEAHQSLYIVHPESTKMYKDLKTSYWWNNMKRDVAQYVE